MAQHRTHFIPAVAGTLSVFLLSGCPNAGTQPPVAGQGSAAPSPSVSASVVVGSPVPNGAESSAPASSVPSAAPTAVPGLAVTLSGKVYDETGSLVDKAKVRVRALDPKQAFDTTVEAQDGSYVVNAVPSGVQVEITASRENWTSRSRVEAMVGNETAINVVNFGGLASNTQDSRGAAYFISKFPEIVAANATYQDSKLTYVIKFSDALNTDNRLRVENALLISTPDPASNGNTINIRSNAPFLNSQRSGQVAWDSAGTTLTFTLDAPLLTSRTDKRTYTLSLIREAGEQAIQDIDGNILGMVEPIESSYSEAFKLSGLVLTTENTALDRWKATHSGTSTFSVPKDDVGPKLVSVTSGPLVINGTDSVRFELTFDEPMRVYPEASGFSGTITTLSNYAFAFSDDPIGNVDLSGTVATEVTSGSQVMLDSPFKFGGASGATVSLSTIDPKVVYIAVPRTFVSSNIRHVKVRAEGVMDPVGNAIQTGNKVDADRTADNIKVGTVR